MLSWRADPRGARLADRHYNRQRIGHAQFVPPAACLVFVTDCGRAVWTTTYPRAEYTKHAWAGAWVNSLFRNEGAGLSSALILEAVAATRALWGDPPALGMVTFVDPTKVRHKRDPGRCYRKAGFVVAGVTKDQGLLALTLAPSAFPEPQLPSGAQMAFLAPPEVAACLASA